MVTKATKISNPKHTGMKIPGAGTLPRAENRSGCADKEEEKQDRELTQWRELTKKNRQRNLVL
jgi:hypothetical protein